MATLFLVRHGETIWHEGNRYCGSTDVPLSPRGVEQAKLLAGWAGRARLDAIWASPLTRAQQTAEPAGVAAGLAVGIDQRLRELSFGRGEGLTAGEMEKLFPQEWAAYRADPVGAHLPGGEDPREAASRAVMAMEEIANGLREGRGLLVIHNALIRLVLAKFLGVPLGNYRRVFPSVQNVAITEIRLEDGQFALVRFNAELAGAREL